MYQKLIRKPQTWIILIVAAGIVYILALQLLLAEGVYFVGDSGLKALLSQSLASGYKGFDLNPPSPTWAKALWIEGLFPVQPPFVYLVGEKYYISYPFTFSLISAPFYAVFGWRGLYLIPWLSTLATWLMYYYLAKRLDLSVSAIAIGMAFLIFATHLTLYSAMYWEHTLSIALAFGGLACLIPGKTSAHISPWAAIGAGVLTSLSVWMRPEQIFVVVFLGAVAVWSFAQAAWSRMPGKRLDFGRLPGYVGKAGWICLAAAVFTGVLYGAANWLVYQNIFGVHSIQVLEPMPWSYRLRNFLDNLKVLTIGSLSFFVYNPVSFFLVGYLFLAWIKPAWAKYEKDWSLWLAFIPLFIIGVSALVPSSAGGEQVGPRFLLLLVPVSILLFSWQIDRLLKNPSFQKRSSRWFVWLTLFIIAVVGIIFNPIKGREYFVENYNLVKAAAQDLQRNPKPTIMIDNHYLAQVFMPALDREVQFFLTTSEDDLSRLSEALVNQQQATFIYLCYTNVCQFYDPENPVRRVYRGRHGYTLQILSVKDLDKYTLFEMRVDSD